MESAKLTQSVFKSHDDSSLMLSSERKLRGDFNGKAVQQASDAMKPSLLVRGLVERVSSDVMSVKSIEELKYSKISNLLELADDELSKLPGKEREVIAEQLLGLALSGLVPGYRRVEAVHKLSKLRGQEEKAFVAAVYMIHNASSIEGFDKIWDYLEMLKNSSIFEELIKEKYITFARFSKLQAQGRAHVTGSAPELAKELSGLPYSIVCMMVQDRLKELVDSRVLALQARAFDMTMNLRVCLEAAKALSEIPGQEEKALAAFRRLQQELPLRYKVLVSSDCIDDCIMALEERVNREKALLVAKQGFSRVAVKSTAPVFVKRFSMLPDELIEKVAQKMAPVTD